VAVELLVPETKTEPAGPRKFLLTCGHVVRENATIGDAPLLKGWGNAHGEILCYQHGTGYTPSHATRRSGEHHYGCLAVVHEFSPYGVAEVPVAKRMDSNDWALLAVQDEDFQKMPVVPFWEALREGDTHCALGFPGGPGLLKSIKWGSLACMPSAGFQQTRKSPPGMLLLDGPDESRPGMSGCGYFSEQTGAFIGLHRASADTLKAVFAIPSVEIALHLKERHGVKLAKGEFPTAHNPVAATAEVRAHATVEPTTSADVDALGEILASVELKDFDRLIVAAHKVAIRPDSFSRAGVVAPPTLAECLYDLQSRALHALLLFVEFCIRRLLQARLDAKALIDWRDAYARRVHPAPKDREGARQAVRKKADELSRDLDREERRKWRAQVVVKPVMGSIRGKEKYELRYALREEEDLSPVRASKTSALKGSLLELKARFAEFFENIRKKAREGQGTIELVEAIVPVEVLFAGSDRWEILDGGMKRPVSRCFGTFLRSYERGYPDAVRTHEQSFDGARDLQRDKWPDSIACGCESWSCVEAADKLCDGLFETWRETQTKAVAALTLTVPAGALNDEHRVAERLIAAGIPVAIWLTGHGGGGAEAMLKLMERLKGQVADLPRCVFGWKDRDNKEHQCTGISLLWDNYDDPLPDLISEPYDTPDT
jgi:hypothetical protein